MFDVDPGPHQNEMDLKHCFLFCVGPYLYPEYIFYKVV